MTTEATTDLRCPECGSRITKAGVRVVNRAGDKKQQYKCVECGRRTLNPKEDRHG